LVSRTYAEVLENRMLSKILEPMWEKVTGEWRKLHNEELDDSYFSRNIITVIKLKKNEMGEVRSTCR
jgi:hypothetical protein